MIGFARCSLAGRYDIIAKSEKREGNCRVDPEGAISYWIAPDHSIKIY
jgi:hypothetical protein